MSAETQREQPSGAVTFLKSIIVFGGVAAAVLLYVVIKGGSEPQAEDLRGKGRLEARQKLEAESEAALLNAEWVDKAKGTVRLPISDAKRAVLADLKAKAPAPSQVKVEPPLVVPPHDPNSKEPAPAALPSAPGGAVTQQFAK